MRPSPRALALAGLVLLAGCTGGPPPTASVEIIGDPAAGGAYKPAVLDVAPGTTVAWVELDTRLHTVTARDDSFGSQFLSEGQTYTVRFNRPGVYRYYCAIHPDMAGEVDVK